MRIGIDCEFSFDANNEFYLVCACATQEDGATVQFWHDQAAELRQYMLAHKADTYIAHNLECAEGHMCLSLGLQPTKFRWHDTMMMSRIVYNKCSLKHTKHSLADCLERERIVTLDKEQKHADQSMCIWRQDCTWTEHLAKLENNKEHLMEYCLSDTAHLIALDAALDAKLSKKLSSQSRIDVDKTVLEPERRASYFGFITAICSEISWRGIPLDPERVKQIISNAPKAIAKLQSDFLAKYPDSFRVAKNKLTKNVAKCREYASLVYGENPPRTASGEISLASEYTKAHEGADDFLADYYELDKRCRALASFSKTDRERNWLGMYIANKGIIRPRINPLAAATGRCGSKPSSGFLFLMGKPFRGLANPPPGKVIIELDYHSEEIGCQAYLTHDSTMAKMYEGPDYYTSVAHWIDPSITSKKDPRRSKYKTIALMSNYGCGSQHLADIAKVSKDEADAILKHLKNMFKPYWKFVHKYTDKCYQDGCTLWFSDGWRISYAGGKVTTLGNWPFQGVGAYILRIMLIELYRANIEVIAPVHDAVLILADEATWRETAARAAQIMRDASERALGTQIDVGDPEVTFHNIANCHSELNTREDYAYAYSNAWKTLSKDDQDKWKAATKYYNMFKTYLAPVETELDADTSNLYVDEPMEEISKK